MAIKFLDKDSARRRMNILGRSSHPFLFLISYDMEQSIVSSLDEVDACGLLYHLGDYTNDAVATEIRKAAEVTAHLEPFSSYQKKFRKVEEHLHRGDSYLVNLTCKVPIDTALSTKEIFRLAEAPYKMWIKNRFVCFSPETFIRIDDRRISSFPMKGTADALQPDALQRLMENRKETAEHATIVDLIRNDLSMVASHVTVNRYRYAQRIDTCRGPLLQTSSEISGVLPPDYRQHLGDIVFSQLPAGSVTGAPKPSTCRIISESEDYDRGFYTGIMGVCCDGRLDSTVLIRFIEQQDGRLFYKAGGGITAQSQCEDEYREIIQKIYVPVR